MTILITGSSGQLGQDFVKFYQQNSNIDLIYPSHADFDITNLISMQNYLQDKNIDIIINCAAYTAVDKAELDIASCFELNTKAIENLINICKKFNILLIQISTDYVFDGTTPAEYTEDSQTCPISIYGKSKAEAEQLILSNLTKYFIIRTSWLFGQFGKNNYVNTMINLLNTKQSLDIVTDEVGSPTYTEDLIKAIDILKDTAEYGIYNIHNAGFISRYEFTAEIAKQIHSNTILNKVLLSDYIKNKNNPVQRPKCNKLSLNKISKYYLMPNWKDALKRYLDIIYK